MEVLEPAKKDLETKNLGQRLPLNSKHEHQYLFSRIGLNYVTGEMASSNVNDLRHAPMIKATAKLRVNARDD